MVKEIPVSVDNKERLIMEYKIIIQENLNNGAIFMHSFPLESPYVREALRFRELDFHSDCIFVPAYCLN